MLPETIIFEIDEPLIKFKSIVSDLSMPTMDLDAVLDQIFTAVLDLSMSTGQIENLAHDMAYGDTLFENFQLEQASRTQIYKAVCEFGFAILRQLEYYRAHDGNGNFPYYYKGQLTNDSIILSKNKQQSYYTSRVYHPRHQPVRDEFRSFYETASYF